MSDMPELTFRLPGLPLDRIRPELLALLRLYGDLEGVIFHAPEDLEARFRDRPPLRLHLSSEPPGGFVRPYPGLKPYVPSADERPEVAPISPLEERAFHSGGVVGKSDAPTIFARGAFIDPARVPKVPPEVAKADAPEGADQGAPVVVSIRADSDARETLGRVAKHIRAIIDRRKRGGHEGLNRDRKD